jgi:hypothetical protein
MKGLDSSESVNPLPRKLTMHEPDGATPSQALQPVCRPRLTLAYGKASPKSACRLRQRWADLECCSSSL